MKTKLNKIYHQYFPEIITGVLLSLIIITGLMVFSIYSGNEIQEGQQTLLQNDKTAMKMRKEFKVKQDKALELMDLIKKENGGSKK